MMDQDYRRIEAIYNVLHLDTISFQVLMAFGIASFLFDYCAIFFALYNRDYAPLKAKQLRLILFCLISCNCWWIGTLHANGILRQRESDVVCALFGVWLQILLGAQLFLIALSFRFWKLYRVFILHLPTRGVSFWVPVMLFSFPLFPTIVALWTLDPSETVTARIDHGNTACHFAPIFNYWLYGNVALNLSIIVVSLACPCTWRISDSHL
jgi:hypothetical protein